MRTLYLFDSGSIFSFLSVVTRVVVVSAMSVGAVNSLSAAESLKAAESLNAAEPVGGTLAQSLAQEGVESLAADALRMGDPMRGAAIFHASYLTCTACHAAGAGLSPLGPNLATPHAQTHTGDAAPLTVSQLREHLVESLLEPSKTISPEYRTTTILTTEGRSISGIVSRESAEMVVVRDAAAGGREIEIPLATLEERSTSAVSLMPVGLVNLLADRQQFLDLVRYLDEIARGGPDRAMALRPAAALLAPPVPAAYEREIDHASFIAEWANVEKSGAALARGEKLYSRVCANCHGTLAAPGSLPTALRFAEGKSKFGSDPHAMYRTLTLGAGQMVAQGWMVPSQKYDVIHYVRETFLKDKNSTQYAAITPEYLAALPAGSSRGPEPSLIEPWRIHDYGPFLSGSIEVGSDGNNVARKGLAVRLDPGAGGVGRGHVWILYELDTLRAAAIWSGDAFIDWKGINFDGSHGTHPHVNGQIIAAVSTLPGWADHTGSFTDPRPLGRDKKPYGPLPTPHARFRSLHHTRDGIVLDYMVGDTRVLETAQLKAGQAALSAATGTAAAAGSALQQPIVARVWWIAPHAGELLTRVAAIDAMNKKTSAALLGISAAADAKLEERDGFYTLVLPAHSEPLVVAVAIAGGQSGPADGEAFAQWVAKQPNPESPKLLVGIPAEKLWDATIETRIATGADAGSFAIDVLPTPAVNPWNAQIRLGGIDFLGTDDRQKESAALCTWDGDVWTVGGLASADGVLRWRRIATGLYQPLGLKVIDGVMYVTCRDRIVTLHDTDGDGLTDRYDTFNTDQQVTEHFHEFAMGLETDAAGNLYYAKSARHAMPAVVPHHGTLLKVTRDGSTTEIVANGFRAANGVCVEPDGTFYVTDQEGHWNPKNRINHVRPGGFYGNMFGYHGVTDDSDTAMEPPVAWITNEFDRSPAELLRVTSKSWTPLVGALLELSYGQGRMHLVLTQTVPPAQAAGMPRLQGGLIALPVPDLPTGIMRGRFHPTDGHLYTCGLFAWAGNRTEPGGLFRVRRTTLPLRMPVELATTADGLRLTFSEPLDRTRATDPQAWHYKSWGLKRTANYGSNHIDTQEHRLKAADLSSDGRTVTLHIEGIAPTWCYEVRWNVADADGAPLEGRIHGTIHSL